MKHAALFFCFLLALLVTASAQEAATGATAAVKVACVGNSITEGSNIEVGKRYPQQLQGLLGNGYEVRNYGLSGRTLLKKGDRPYWNEAKYKEVLQWSPDIVVIKLGTNDSKPQNWQYKNDFVDNYIELIDSFRKLPSRPAIFICYPIPVFEENWGINATVVENEILPMIDQIAKKSKVKIIDLFSAFEGKGPLVPDGVHPDAAGATILASTVYGVVHKAR